MLISHISKNYIPSFLSSYISLLSVNSRLQATHVCTANMKSGPAAGRKPRETGSLAAGNNILRFLYVLNTQKLFQLVS